ncbi:MAG: hypothetical protein KA712_11025 [Myxococcales bacterium]|nr:hypothetical protein [Myxococcales bacterium]
MLNRPMGIKRAIVPAIIFAGLGTAVVLELSTKQGVECEVCISFQGRQKCAKARADEAEQAEREAQSSACSLLTSGVSEAVKCPRIRPDKVTCK